MSLGHEGAMDSPPDTGPAEQSDDSANEPRSSRVLVVLTVASLCLALAAGGVAGYLWFQLDDLESRTERSLRSLDSDVDAVAYDVGNLDTRVDSLESDVGWVPGYDSLSDQLDDLVSAVSTIERDVGYLESNAGDSYTDDLLVDALTDLRDCVNSYMVTVGNAGGGRYTYYTC
jgi:hypothetical protein